MYPLAVPTIRRFLSRFSQSKSKLTPEDIKDVAVIKPSAMEYQERLLIEGGEFVGATGTFEADQVVPTASKLPDG
jgi:hypothetical protein